MRTHHTDRDFGPLFTGELLRDEAIAKVSDNNERWMESCIGKVQDPHYFMVGSFTGEDLRRDLSFAIGLPQHSNAWGALVNTLVRRKIIKPTGEYRAMRDSSSHARKTPVYSK